jgi:broad specificity phosphatase PhoE
MSLFHFIRHAATDTSAPDQRDTDRRLTAEGREQARQFASRVARPYELVLASPARRAVQTAELIARGQPVVEVPALYHAEVAEDDERIDEIYDELGEATLRSFLAKDATGAIERYGHIGTDRIRTLASGHDGAVLVVGHGVLLCAIGLSMTRDEALLDVTLGRCEGFAVRPNGTVQMLL